MPPQADPERREAWQVEQRRRQLKRFVTRRGPRPDRKPKETK